MKIKVILNSRPCFSLQEILDLEPDIKLEKILSEINTQPAVRVLRNTGARSQWLQEIQYCQSPDCPSDRAHSNYHDTEQDYESSRLRKRLGTKEYNKLTNLRAGIEGIPSVLRRIYDIDNMPVMGLVSRKLFLNFKIAAMNFKKLLKDNKPALT